MEQADLIASLDAFPGQESGDLDALEVHVACALARPAHPDLDRALFGIFERFPDEDGYGVYWSILHGLEARSEYENGLRRSIERRPAIFTLRMLDGMVNAGRFECGGVPVLVLLEQVASSSMAEPEVRRNAAEILQYCRTRVGE